MSITTAREYVELESSLKTGELSLRHLNLDHLPSELFDLTHLHALDISGNNLTNLPKEIGNLRSLKRLQAAINKITHLPDEIGHLTSLRSLQLGINKLTSLPKSIGKLRLLEDLSIGKNPISEFPDELGQLLNLRSLIANDMGLQEFPVVFTRFNKLLSLNMANNKFATLPPEFVNLTRLNLLYLENCPLTLPIEIVARGPQAIINYLHAFDTHGPTFKIREAKLIIVGQGAVGKTCLVKRLVKDEYDPDSLTTEGIEIDKWEISASDGNPFDVNIWDFGGQEIYHATHQFFLTKRSLYLFVWDARREDNILTFDYWFNVIKLLSDASSVIVVMNKSDERTKSIDEDSLIQKFPNIDSFHKVSAKKRFGIQQLKSQISNAIVQLPHVGDILPQSWSEIREYLESLNENCITYDYYLEICADYKLPQDKAGFLAQYYHDLGAFLHFNDNPILQKVVFLKPEWATNAVYKLVDTQEVIESLGRFHFSQLDIIWADYPSQYHIHLLELMKKFELCFALPDDETFIVPELLSISRPDFKWIETDNLHFIYQYDFMPAGIITRFTVRVHDLIEGGVYWKNGVQIAQDDTKALIIAEPLNRRLKISILGPEAQYMLAIIRREIEYIHSTLNHPDVKQLVPCTCMGCRQNSSPFMHNFDYLLRAKARDKWTVECNYSLMDVPIVDVLRIPIPEHPKRKKRRKVKVYGDYYDAPQHIGAVIKVGGITIRKEYFSDIGESIGISMDDYMALVKALAHLPSNEINRFYSLARQTNEAVSDPTIVKKIKSFAEKHSIPVIQGLGTSAVYELLKYLFI